MLVKSKRRSDHFGNLGETFDKLREYNLKINPEKCTFGVTEEKFLRYMISEHGIEPNPDKIEALIQMKPPKNYKDIRKFKGCLAALNRFISKSGEKNFPFFKTLRRMGREKFSWDSENNKAFGQLKAYLGSPQLLARAEEGETLQLYLRISDVAVSSVLIRRENDLQKPIYYVSHLLRGHEERYPNIDKTALSLVLSARKLKNYFASHPIHVIID